MKKGGKKSAEIARLLFKESKLEITPEAIRYQINKSTERNGDLYHHHSSGRPDSLDDRTIRHILSDITDDPFLTIRTAAAIHETSRWTIGRTLEKKRLFSFTAAQKHYLRPEHVENRLRWAGEREGARWRDVIFTDEAAVVSFDKKGKMCAPSSLHHNVCANKCHRGVIRPMGERFSPKYVKPHFHSGRTSVLIWGGIRYNHKLPLVWIKTTKTSKFTGERYLEEILGPVLSGEIAQMVLEGKEPLVVEDRSRIHFKRTILPSKNLLGIVNLDHPAASPDLNPIEHMWNIMKASLRKRKTKFTSVGELWKWIQEEWDAIPITTVNKLIDSMEERRLAVIRVKGMSTGY